MISADSSVWAGDPLYSVTENTWSLQSSFFFSILQKIMSFISCSFMQTDDLIKMSNCSWAHTKLCGSTQKHCNLMVITHQKNFLIAFNRIISFLPVCQIFCWIRYAFNQNWPLSCHCRTYLTVKERIRKQICSYAQALLRVAMRGAICWFGGTRA